MSEIQHCKECHDPQPGIVHHLFVVLRDTNMSYFLVNLFDFMGSIWDKLKSQLVINHLS